MHQLKTVAVAIALLCTSIIPAMPNCYYVPQCHNESHYENRPYQQNICQYNGTQKWCYLATRYQMVVVTQRVCKNVRRC